MTTDRITQCVTGCGTAAGGYFLCRRCTDTLVRELKRIPALCNQLRTTIAKQTSTGTGIGVATHTAEHPLPVNLAAADVARDLNNTLGTWALDIGARTADTLLVDTPERAANYLVDHTSTMRTHPAAEELHTDLTQAITRGWRSVDLAAARRYVGPCDQCGEDMYARNNTAEIHCAHCGTRYDTDDRRAWLLDQARDQLATASTIARALPNLVGVTITPAMIRGYAHRGRLVPRTDMRGKKRYKVGDVIDLVLST